jgi:hypothetical protein
MKRNCGNACDTALYVQVKPAAAIPTSQNVSIVFGLPTIRRQRLTADTGPTQCLPREMANQPADFQTLVLAGYKHACYRNPDPTVIIKGNVSA